LDLKNAAVSSGIRRLLHSVRLRLTLWFVVILGLILAAFSVFIYTRQVQVLTAETTNRLVAQSTQLEAYFSRMLISNYENENEGEKFQISPPGGMPLIQENEVMAIFDANGQLLQITGAMDPASLENAWGAFALKNISRVPNQVTLKDHGETYLMALTPLNSERAAVAYLIVGSPLDAQKQLPRLALTLIASNVVILILAFGGGYWLADRAMNPVQVITHTAREIGEGDLRKRLRLSRADELGELADTFDQMLDRLQAAFERQRQFTADASHELRTPLSIIELEANRALEHRRTIEEYQKALSVIQVENEWMSGLVNELLTLARLDARQVPHPLKAMDLSELTVEVIERLEPLAQQKGVTLAAGDLEQARVLGEASYLSQMLINLIENAIKYAQKDGTQVRVDSGGELREKRPGGWVRVSDNGPGIPPEHLPHLFDRFYRVDAARSREAEDLESIALGSGLGLAIVQSIVSAYGGYLDVHSELGEGTVFTVWLPGPE
jgi:signal transduction histidine kinase